MAFDLLTFERVQNKSILVYVISIKEAFGKSELMNQRFVHNNEKDRPFGLFQIALIHLF